MDHGVKVFRVPLSAGATLTATAYRAAASPSNLALILGHGAGAGQRSPFMVETATGLAALGINTVTFDFPYIEQGRRIPDRPVVLHESYQAVIRSVRQELADGAQSLFIGGKSMGGRIATEVAAADSGIGIAGIVLLGYPLHPPGRPAQRRDKHLALVGRPMLFVQGSRDAFGTPAELEPVLTTLGTGVVLHVVEGGDHSLKVSKLGRDAQAGIYESARRTIADWIRVTAAGASR
jgi:predicted alpha/beta-hydrolase family hydrolase